MISSGAYPAAYFFTATLLTSYLLPSTSYLLTSASRFVLKKVYNAAAVFVNLFALFFAARKGWGGSGRKGHGRAKKYQK